MTCAEVKILMKTTPVDSVSVAETAAVVAHVMRCQECRSWMQQKAAAGRTVLTPARVAELKAEGVRRADRIRDDAEAMEVVFGDE